MHICRSIFKFKAFGCPGENRLNSKVKCKKVKHSMVQLFVRSGGGQGGISDDLGCRINVSQIAWIYFITCPTGKEIGGKKEKYFEGDWTNSQSDFLTASPCELGGGT